MSFLCELGLALGRTLAEVWSLSAAEISTWLAYRAQYGFPVDRVTGGAAIGAAYLGATWGGKANPNELLPRFSQAKRRPTLADVEAVKDWFAQFQKA